MDSHFRPGGILQLQHALARANSQGRDQFEKGGGRRTTVNRWLALFGGSLSRLSTGRNTLVDVLFECLMVDP
jgi:hypothetical protein